MQERESKNLNFYWSTLFVRSIYEQGVRHVVISPGSRSTPLTLAFASHPGFKKSIIIDERSAAFTALGISKGSGVPACLVCTSGTALANYLPAVIEASQTNTPLIVASADRPPHLRGIGANQTIDQLKIFGDYPVYFHEVGEPRDYDRHTERMQRAAIQAVRYSMDRGGVSHLNFSFSKPFEPGADFLGVIEQENDVHANQNFAKYTSHNTLTELDETFWSDLIAAERPLIIAGPDKPDSVSTKTVVSLAKLLNAPILSESGSNIPASKYTITGFDGYLRSDSIKEQQAPDLIIRFGEEAVSKAIQLYLETYNNVLQIRFYERDIIDETLTAQKYIELKGKITLPEISINTDKDWIRDWRKIQKEFFAFREEQLHPTSPLTDGYVFHNLVPYFPKNSFIMLSNSFPVRDLSLFGDYDGREIYVNRGAAGIDGINSTALGLSLSLDKPGFLFVGDIAFLHDSNALLNLKTVTQPLFIIILNNGGGSIFKMLPISSYKKKYAAYFETPQEVSIAALCRAHKLHHILVSRPEQLFSNIEDNLEQPGVHILECITDAEDSMDLRKLLWNYKSDNG
jgi:2-succinyl-5-enolpyruvyl-6-hydroxy-3-cyclohexene-1-carboxylate synthase